MAYTSWRLCKQLFWSLLGSTHVYIFLEAWILIANGGSLPSATVTQDPVGGNTLNEAQWVAIPLLGGLGMHGFAIEFLVQ